MTVPSILVACGDAGGAAAVAPVVRQLADESRLRPVVFASPPAEPKFAALGLLYAPPPSGWDDLVSAIGPAAILTGTSWGPEGVEKRVIHAARARGIPTLTVLDFWSNYRLRFADAEDRLVFVPDKIAIMDDTARTQMIAVGFPAERLVVTGAPQLEKLLPDGVSPVEVRARARARLAVDNGQPLVLFASQPLRALYGARLAYDEVTVFRIVRSAMRRLEEETGVRATLCVRRHPREEQAGMVDDRGAPVLSAQALADWESVLAADVVVGISSVLLVTASYLGRPVISVQPSDELAGVVPTVESGLAHLVRDETALVHAIARTISTRTSPRDDATKADGFPSALGATQRVVDLIYQMAGVAS